MPISYLSHRRSSPAGPVICIAYAAVLLLQACFSATGEESPYTVPAGEEVDMIQLETAPDGSILLLARVAMHYRHEDPQTPWDTMPLTRNFHTILLRRSNGVWNATPFKNVQDYNSHLPVLIPVTGSGFQVFLRDGGTVRRYAMRDGDWLRQPNPAMPLGYYNSWQGDSRNWYRFPHLAMPSDSVLIPIDQKWNSNGMGMQVEVRESGGKVIRLDGTLTPLDFHAADRFRGLVGMEYQLQGDPENGNRTALLVHYYWAPGDSTAHRTVLSDKGMTPDAYFGNYQGGMAIFLSTMVGYRTYPLDPDGSSHGYLEWSNPDSLAMLSSTFAADSEGCFHNLTTTLDSTSFYSNGLLHQNTCFEGLEDTLYLPSIASDRIGYPGSLRFRIGPQGRPITAFIFREAQIVGGQPGPIVASKLIFAELRNGRWQLETVPLR